MNANPVPTNDCDRRLDGELPAGGPHRLARLTASTGPVATTRPITAHDCVRAAGIAVVDTRAVRRVLDGKRTFSTTRQRVLSALATLGLIDPSSQR